jgi:hypothetical protein
VVSDETLSPELAAACKRIYTDFRIYVLRQPQVHLVLAADRVTGQRALFDLLAIELDAAIAAAPNDPDVGEARRLLDDYRARSPAARRRGHPVSRRPGGLERRPERAATVRRRHAPGAGGDRSAKKDARKILALLTDGTSEGGKTAGKA